MQQHRMKLLILQFSYVLLTGAVEIVSGPQTITNATLWGSAEFVCVLNNEDAFPGWNIDGTDYLITDLPYGYDFKSISYSNTLIVTSVQREMNNSLYYCYVVTLQERLESERARLIIQFLSNTTSKYPRTYTDVTVLGSSTVLSSDDDIILSTADSYVAPNITYSTEPQLMIQTTYLMYLLETDNSYVNQTSVEPTSTSVNETQFSQPSTDSEVIVIFLTTAAVITILIIIMGTFAVGIVCYRRSSDTSVVENNSVIYETVKPVTANPPLYNMTENSVYIKLRRKISTNQNPAYELTKTLRSLTESTKV